MGRHLRIATRKSPLAMWQANHVATALQQTTPGLTCEFVTKETAADLDLTATISQLGGKGAFSKEIQQLVLAGAADIAVHSAKDLPSVAFDDLTIGAFCRRGDPRDALIGCSFEDLKAGSVVATGANRRRALLMDLCPGVSFVELRGNIDTRLSHAGEVDALVIAAVALQRLERTVTYHPLPPSVFIPQVGQGAIAVECRTGAPEVIDLLASIDDQATRATVSAERAFLVELGGDCTLPAGAYAHAADQSARDGQLKLHGMLAAEPVQGQPAKPLVWDTIVGNSVDIGKELAARLRRKIEGT